MPSLSAKIRLFLVLTKIPKKIAIKLFLWWVFHMKTRVSLRYSVTDCRSGVGLLARRIRLAINRISNYTKGVGLGGELWKKMNQFIMEIILQDDFLRIVKEGKVILLNNKNKSILPKNIKVSKLINMTKKYHKIDNASIK